MILPWKNYLGENNEVSFETPDGVKYIAYPQGKMYILKIDVDGTETKLYELTWAEEKQLLSEKYSDIYGDYEPRRSDELDEDDDKFCFFGKTSEGLYLDRIQRPEYVMDHSMTAQIFEKDGWGRLHTPDGGKTIFKTEWCDRLGEYYNCMRCDVFPDNPGWQKIEIEEAKQILQENSEQFVDVDLVIWKLENGEYHMPIYDNEPIIGNWLIP